MALKVISKRYWRLILNKSPRTLYNCMNLSYSSQKNVKIATNDEMNWPKYISLRHCPKNASVLSQSQEIKCTEKTVQRPLTLVFAWMLANDKSLEKYRQLWLKRGFDVLTVHTSPFDLLVPPIGSRIVSKNILRVISKLIPPYNEIVVHAFSVGAFQFGETLLQIREQKQYFGVLDRIKGVVLDSAVFIQDCAPGLSRAITLHPVIQPTIERLINIYLKLFPNISIKNYEKAIHEVITPFAKYPGLILYSKDDMVSSVEKNEELIENWIKMGNQIQIKCWDESTHVSHLKLHHKEYVHELETFLKSLNLTIT